MLATVVATVATVARGQQMACYFVFRDSAFDNGNNNNLATQAKGGRISLSAQIANHQGVVGKGATVTQERLNKCLYTIHIGSNDYINNYFFKPASPTISLQNVTPDNFYLTTANLYATQLKNLYGLGARKFVLCGTSRIGCVPRVVETLGGGKGCAVEVNAAVDLFNKKLRVLVDGLNKSLAGAKFTFVDMNGGDASSYAKLGFTVSDKSCCTIEPGQELCAAKGPVCEDRKKFVFWDKVHSTEAVNGVVAKALFSGINTSPFTIAQLIQ